MQTEIPGTRVACR